MIDAALARKVADLTESGGTNLWFEKDDAWWAESLGLPAGTKRCTDTLDVWIDSGSSHVAVMDRHPELSCPADLYLEATDQHRGWFQSSLMLSVAVRDKAPYKAVMTHGFVVDQDKKKISKSEAKKSGKPVDAAYFYDKYGADILRLWVSSVDWQNEVPFGEDLFKQTAEPYRRFRNTLRILLANLNDFDITKDGVGPEAMTLLDRWILERLHQVVTECREAYAAFEFRKVFNTLNQFCAVDLSALYRRHHEGPHVLRCGRLPAPESLADGDSPGLRRAREAHRARPRLSPLTRHGSMPGTQSRSTSSFSPRPIRLCLGRGHHENRSPFPPPRSRPGRDRCGGQSRRVQKARACRSRFPSPR
jgi:leucyl-tRNA synthetase